MNTKGDYQERVLTLERVLEDLVEAIEDPFLPHDDLEAAVEDARYVLYQGALEEEI